MNDTPPIGVIAPSMRFPVTASRYRLPEKITMPASNNPQYPVKFSDLGIRIGVNYVVYAMTH